MRYYESQGFGVPHPWAYTCHPKGPAVFDEDAQAEIVLELAEDFLDRYRKGERPPLREYVDRHPELASEIKEVFPAMAMMENIAFEDESLEGEASRGVQ